MLKAAFKIFLLLICLQIAQNVFSKDEFKPGYVVNYKGDTLRGLVNCDDWFITPERIAYKPSVQRSTQYYHPKDILAFGYEDVDYLSAVVQKEISPEKELQKDPNLHLVTDTVFLKYLIRGEKSLLYFVDIDKKENFYIQEDTAINLLIHKVYVEFAPTRKEYHNMRFLGQLSRYFWDEQSILEDISQTTYDKSSLEDLFRLYYKRQGKPLIVKANKKESSTEFSVFAGASVTMVGLENDLVKAQFGPSVDFTAGMSVNLPMIGRIHDWSFYNELLYSSYQTQGYVGFYFPTNIARFDAQYLKMNNMVRFSPSWFFFDLGISSGICLKQSNSILQEIKGYELGIAFGAGVRYKNLALELREDLGDGLSPYVYVLTDTKRFQVLFSYCFQ